MSWKDRFTELAAQAYCDSGFRANATPSSQYACRRCHGDGVVVAQNPAEPGSGVLSVNAAVCPLCKGSRVDPEFSSVPPVSTSGSLVVGKIEVKTETVFCPKCPTRFVRSIPGGAWRGAVQMLLESMLAAHATEEHAC